MEAIIKFNLPDEAPEYETASKAWELSMIIWDLDQWLRSETKYQQLDDKTHEAYDKVRDKLRELMSDQGLTFDSKIWT